MGEPTKRYYSISEVADRFKVSKSLIRYWENQFSFLRPTKLSNGERRFTSDNLEQFEVLYHLLKVKRFTIEGAKQELAKNKSSHLKRLRAIDALKSIRSELQALHDLLDEEG